MCISNVTFLMRVCVLCVGRRLAPLSEIDFSAFFFFVKTRCYSWAGICRSSMLGSWKPRGGVKFPKWIFMVGLHLCSIWPSLCLCVAKQFKKEKRLNVRWKCFIFKGVFLCVCVLHLCCFFIHCIHFDLWHVWWSPICSSLTLVLSLTATWCVTVAQDSAQIEGFHSSAFQSWPQTSGPKEFQSKRLVLPLQMKR